MKHLWWIFCAAWFGGMMDERLIEVFHWDIFDWQFLVGPAFVGTVAVQFYGCGRGKSEKP